MSKRFKDYDCPLCASSDVIDHSHCDMHLVEAFLNDLAKKSEEQEKEFRKRIGELEKLNNKQND